MQKLLISSLAAVAAVAVIALGILGPWNQTPQTASIDEDARLEVERLRSELVTLQGQIDQLSQSFEFAMIERADEGDDGEDGAAAASEEGGGAKSALAAAEELRRTSGDEGLRAYVAQVIEDDRRERAEKRQQAIAQHQAEIEALHQGPYGDQNFRVNSMAKKLGLSDRQKQHYYDLVVDYNAQIKTARQEEAKDRANRQVYRDRRKVIRKEFATVFAQALDPEQTEVFNALNEWETRPDGSVVNAVTFHDTWGGNQGAAALTPSVRYYNYIHTTTDDGTAATGTVEAFAKPIVEKLERATVELQVEHERAASSAGASDK